MTGCFGENAVFLKTSNITSQNLFKSLKDENYEWTDMTSLSYNDECLEDIKLMIHETNVETDLGRALTMLHFMHV